MMPSQVRSRGESPNVDVFAPPVAKTARSIGTGVGGTVFAVNDAAASSLDRRTGTSNRAALGQDAVYRHFLQLLQSASGRACPGCDGRLPGRNETPLSDRLSCAATTSPSSATRGDEERIHGGRRSSGRRGIVRRDTGGRCADLLDHVYDRSGRSTDANSTPLRL
jgi:hypothetical protein